MPEAAATIAARQATHGDFADLAALTQSLRATVRMSPSYRGMSPIAREALEAIILKLARICAGDPHFADHWHDIAGYARLVEDRLPPAS